MSDMTPEDAGERDKPQEFGLNAFRPLPCQQSRSRPSMSDHMIARMLVERCNSLVGDSLSTTVFEARPF
jgi:hypothetical protein